LTVEEILYIMKGLNKVFKYMIKIGLVHRDIKPDNILIKYVDSSKTKYIPKIADFGLSRTLKDGLATSEVGTPQYWAPEISSQQYYDNKCDLFSIGVMLYRCYFNSSPFKSNLSDRPIYSDKKLKDCEDKTLDDLINRLLIIDPAKRISWEEYFNHPFFKEVEDLNSQLVKLQIDDDDKEHQVINFYDYVIEKIIIQNNIEKKNLQYIDPQSFISINECLNSKDDSEFILGILGKYLEQIRIKALIEKNESPRNYELREYHKNIFQMICNNYILKKVYLLDFDLGEKRLKQIVNNPIERGNFNEKLNNIILKEYHLKEEEIFITNQRRENNKFTVMIFIKSNFSKEITKNKLIDIFGEKYDDLKTLSKIDIEKIIPLIKLNKSMLCPQNNNKENKWKIGEKRGGEDYIPPLGWISYAINIQKCFNDKNYNWIGSQNKPGEWCTAYCGLKGITQSMEQIYENEDDFRHPGEKIGIGVYCTSDPSIMEKETETIDANGKKYMVGFMLRIKPDKIRACAKNNKIWIVNGNDNEFRPYGILVKEL
jgi:serine/threonine protein kinase